MASDPEEKEGVKETDEDSGKTVTYEPDTNIFGQKTDEPDYDKPIAVSESE